MNRIGFKLACLLAALALGLTAAAQDHGHVEDVPHGAHAIEDAHGEAVHAEADHGAAAHGEQPALIAEPSHGIVPAVTTLVIFALLLAVLGKFAWGPIVAGLRDREDRIRRDIADAEAARARAEATLKEYSAKLAAAEEQIRQMLTDATAQGEKAATNIRMRGQQEAEEIKERATRDIDAARKQAVAEVYEQAAALATNVAEKILRRELRPEDQRDLVSRSLEQLQTVKS